MDKQETFRPAFTDLPGTILAGIPISNLRLVNPDISYGLAYYESCARHITNTYKASKVYIVASKSLCANNADELDKLVDAIGKDKVVGIKKGITPHTPWSEILQITKECREAGVDCLVTLGAGSITDGCKLVVLVCIVTRSIGKALLRLYFQALANEISTPEQLARYSVESSNIPTNVAEPFVPLITIPTSLSGGEYFSLAGGTDDSTNHKQGFLHSGMGSRLIILDPELCLTTPAYHWLSTGFRSFDHCIEALCCLEATSSSDQKAEKGLRLLAPNLLKCKSNPNDIQARQQCQLAVGYAMDNIRAGIPMGGSHAIGHQLGKSDTRQLQLRPPANRSRSSWSPPRRNILHNVPSGNEIQHHARRLQPRNRQTAGQDQSHLVVRAGSDVYVPDSRLAERQSRLGRFAGRLCASTRPPENVEGDEDFV